MDTHRFFAQCFSRTARRRLERALAYEARLYRRLQGLADVAAGEGIAAGAKRLRVQCSTVHRWIEGYAIERAPQSLADRARRGRPPMARALSERHLQALLESDPRHFGFWTVPLLAGHLRAQGLPISARTLRRRIRAARFRWKRPRWVYRRRADHIGAKTGGSFDA